MSVIGTLLREDRSTYREPEDWHYEALVGAARSGGVAVNAKTALTYSPVWRAVNLIAGDVAKLPLLVYKRVGEGKERAPAHPAFKLLHRKANPDLPAFYFKQALIKDVLVRGNGYAYIERRRNGSPMGLYPLDAAKTWPVLKDGVLSYIYKPEGEEIAVPAWNIFHVRGLGNGIEGMSVITYARKSLGLGMSAQEYGKKFFDNSALYSIALEHPGELGDVAAQHLRDTWKERHAGVGQSHGIAIFEEGMKATQLNFSNEDAQFLGTREFEIREVANWFGVPPHKLGDTTRTAYNSLEQENQSYLDEALDPRLVAWEAECWAKLLSRPEQDRDTHVIEFLRQALVRANLIHRGTFYHNALQDGWMNRDEIRGRENLNPIPDGKGKVFLVPLNMAELGDEEAKGGDDKPSGDEPGEDEKGGGSAASAGQMQFRGLLEDVLARMSRRLAVHCGKAARNPKRFPIWLERTMDADHRRTCEAAVTPVVDVVNAWAEGGVHLDSPELVTELFSRFRSELQDIPPEQAAAVCVRLEHAIPAGLADDTFRTEGGNTDAPNQTDE